jgi:hypothetical protein
VTLLQRLVRKALRFAYPEYEAQQRQLLLVSRGVERLEKEARTRTQQQASILKDVAKAVRALPTRADLEVVRRDLTRTASLVDRQARITSRFVRRGDGRSEHSRDERRVLQRLERLTAGDRPIVVGPWTGEVGFELLYWVPFVSWFRQHFDVDPRRLIVVSRGGVASWYARDAHRYVDLFAHASADEYREATNLSKKQRGPSRFDLTVLRRMARAEQWGRVRLLHPQLMYRLFWEFWKGRAAADRVTKYSSYAPIAARAPQESRRALPASYVAARFYFSNAFPETPANRAFVNEVLTSLAEVTDVVLLNTPFRVDDHHDFIAASHPRIHAVGEMPPERNLAIQTAVIQGAQAFVGTYGGYAYLAPLCGVPSVSFYSTDAFFRHHLDLAQQMVADLGLGAGSLIALHMRDAGVLRVALQHTRVPWPRPVSAEDGVLKP